MLALLLAALVPAPIAAAQDTEPDPTTVPTTAPTTPPTDDDSTVVIYDRPADEGDEDVFGVVGDDVPIDGRGATMASVTGQRRGAATIVSGVYFTDADTPIGTSVTLDALPDGTSIAWVAPSVAAPERGAGWACDATTCELLSVDGASSADIGRGAPIAIGLTPTGDPTPGATMTATFDGSEPIEVSLDRDDGLVLDDPALLTRAVGPERHYENVTEVVSIFVTQVGEVTDPIVVSGLETIGEMTALFGDGWDCDDTTCTHAPSTNAYDELDPITAIVASPDVDEHLPVTAEVTATSGALSATGAYAFEIRDRTTAAADLSAEFVVGSVMAPAEQYADVAIHPYDAGTFAADVEVTADFPDGVTPRWDDAAGAGWTCATSSCSRSAPLDDDVSASEFRLPLDVDDVEPSIVDVEFHAAFEPHDADEAATNESYTASFVVTTPSASELLPLASGGDPNPPEGVDLGALEYLPRRQRPLTVDVVNTAGRSVPSGSTIHLRISADDEQTIVAIDETWACTLAGEPVDTPFVIDADAALTCDRSLDTNLAFDESLAFDITLDRSEAGATGWTAVAAVDDDPIDDNHMVSFVTRTVAVGPRLTTALELDERLRADSTTAATLVIGNTGEAPAASQTVLVETPSGLEIMSADGPGWSCRILDLVAAPATTTCGRVDELAPGEFDEIHLTMRGAASGRHTIWLRAEAPGQAATQQRIDLVDANIDVDDAAFVDAGPDRTVVSPTTADDGSTAATPVTIYGRVDLASRDDVEWRQVCDDPCAHAVEWLTGDGEPPASPTATWRLPGLDARHDPVEVEFELRAGDRYDRVAITVVAQTLPLADLVTPDDDTGGGGGDDDTGGGGGDDDGSDGADDRERDDSDAGASSTTIPSVDFGDIIPAPTVTIASPDEVPTRTDFALSASATGASDLNYEWRQVGGPPVTVDADGSDDRPFVFAALSPDLEPDQDRVDLTFELVVTDERGATASAQTSVGVVWPDDGLDVELAAGRRILAVQSGGTIGISSTVATSTGPFRYDWSLDDPNGLAEPPIVDDSDAGRALIGTTGDVGSFDVELGITDDFGRVATDSVQVQITRYDPSNPPADLCDAVEALAAGGAATLSDSSGEFVLRIASASGADTCEQIDIEFSDADASLPGGFTLSDASGHITAIGISLDSGVVTSPPSWGIEPQPLSDPLVIQYSAGGALSGLTGTMSLDGVPVVALPTWNGSTVVDFAAVAAPDALGLRQPSPSASPQPSGVASPQTTAPPTSAPPAAVTPASTSAPPSTPTSGPDDTIVPATLAPDTGPDVPPVDIENFQIVQIAAKAATTTGGPGRVELYGDANPSGDGSLVVLAEGLARFGATNPDLAGEISFDLETATWDVNGGFDHPTPLADSLTLSGLDITWDANGVRAEGQVDVNPANVQTPILDLEIDYPIDGQPTASIGSSPWSPGGTAPAVTLSGRASGIDDDFQLEATGTDDSEFDLAADVIASGLTTTVSTTCSGECSTRTSTTLDARVNDSAPVELSGSLGDDPVLDVVGTFDRIDLSDEVAVTDGTLGFEFGPDDDTTGSGTGTARLLDDDAEVALDFDSTRTVLTTELGDREPTPGWRFTDALLALSTRDGDLETRSTAGDEPIQVALEANTLTGIAGFVLPSSLTSSGVLPPEVTSGLATFPIAADGSLDDAVYRLTVPDPDDWYVVGDADARSRLRVTDIAYDLAVTPTTVSATVDGGVSGALARVDDQPAEEGTWQLDGTLGGADTVLHATLTPDDDTGILGVEGFGLDDVSIDWTLAADAHAALTALATPDAATATNLGMPGDLPFQLTGELTDPGRCIAIDTTPDNELPAIDIGSEGIVMFDHAEFVIATQRCAHPDGEFDRGLWLLVTDGEHDPLSLSADPTTLAVSGTDQIGTFTIDALRLDDTRFDFDVDEDGWAIDVTGSASIFDDAIDLSARLASDNALATGNTAIFTGQLDELIVRDQRLIGLELTVPTTIGRHRTIADDISGEQVADPMTATASIDVVGNEIESDVQVAAHNGEIAALIARSAPEVVTLLDRDRINSTTWFLTADEQSATLNGFGGALDFDGWSITERAPVASNDGDAPDDGTTVVTGAPITEMSVAKGVLTIEFRAPLPVDGAPLGTFGGTYDTTGSQPAYRFEAPIGGTPHDHVTSGDHGGGDHGDEHSHGHGPTVAGLVVSGDVTIDRTTASGAQMSPRLTMSTGLPDVDDSKAVVLSGGFSPGGPVVMTSTSADVAIRGFYGGLSLAVGESDVDHVLSVEGTYAVERPNCALWSEQPTLTGEIRGGGHGTTAYQLSGPSRWDVPGFEEIKDLNGGDAFDVTLSGGGHEHHTDIPPGPSFGHGLSFALGANFPAFSVGLAVSFHPGECGFAASGNAMFSSAGATGASATNGLDSLTGGGLSADLSTLLGGAIDSTLGDALGRERFSEVILEHNETRAEDGETDLAAAETAVDEAEQRVRDADLEIAQADTAYQRQRQQLARATAEIDAELARDEMAQIRINLDHLNNDVLPPLEQEAADAHAAVTAAEQEVEDAEAEADELKQAKQFYVSFGVKFCGTCGDGGSMSATAAGAVTVPIPGASWHAGAAEASAGAKGAVSLMGVVDIDADGTWQFVEFELEVRGALTANVSVGTPADWWVGIKAAVEGEIGLGFNFTVARPSSAVATFTVGVRIFAYFEAEAAGEAWAPALHGKFTLASIDASAGVVFTICGSNNKVGFDAEVEMTVFGIGFGPFETEWPAGVHSCR